MLHLSDQIKKSAEALGIYMPANLPMYDSAPNIAHLLEWADSQVTPKLRAIAHKMVGNLQHIKHEQFLAALQNTISDFEKKIADNPFVIVVTGNQYKAACGCSERWVPALALEYCLQKAPNEILDLAELAEYLKANPEIKNVLLLDDAAYSGEQINDGIKYIQHVIQNSGRNTAEPINLHIGIPYMTDKAATRITAERKQKEIKLQINLLAHQTITSLREILDEQDIAYLQAIEFDLHLSQTLTYFDHRFADTFSAFQGIYIGTMMKFNFELLLNHLGYSLHKDYAQKEKLQFIADDDEVFKKSFPNYARINPGYNIPTIVKPYARTQDDYEQLRKSIEKNQLGPRSAYPVVNKEMAKIIAETKSAPKTAQTPYKKTATSAEQQQSFDQAIQAKINKPKPQLKF